MYGRSLSMLMAMVNRLARHFELKAFRGLPMSRG